MNFCYYVTRRSVSYYNEFFDNNIDKYFAMILQKEKTTKIQIIMLAFFQVVIILIIPSNQYESIRIHLYKYI